ncbi:DinB family protein [Streptomyces sp. NPDC020362]|uniref:DinB family protein n=1 Tax=unclassified Streptomyces TaxID=2593676 RepID=UPI0033FFEC3C
MSMSSPEKWRLSEKDGFSGGEGGVYRVLVSRRRAFLNLIQDMPPSAWIAPSRCSDWSIHQVVRHVRDVARVNVARLEASPHPFGTIQFDPKTSPAEWMAHSEGESPQQTMNQLGLLFLREESLFLYRMRHGFPDLLPGQLRRQVHWSVTSVHCLWDAWMHERDICLPLGRAMSLNDDELRLMVMYSLMAAAAPAAWVQNYVDTVVGLSGSPDSAYHVAHSDGDVHVYAGGSPQHKASMETVVDSLAGRGPELSEVFRSSGESVRKLALLRAAAT